MIIANTDKRKKHGLFNTPEFKIWWGIQLRCNYSGNQAYARYGARGIRVCDRWLDKKLGFVNFLSDMGNKPSKNHQIDRIDGTKGYSPNNCRWVTLQQQHLNKNRKPNSTGFFGIYQRKRKSGKYHVNVRVNRVEHFGDYSDKYEAAAVRDVVMMQLYPNEKFPLNFEWS